MNDRAVAAVEMMRPFAGETVRFVQVLGMNTLKTLNPSLEEASGEEIRDLSVQSESQLTIQLESLLLYINLERVGVVKMASSSELWTFGQGAMPTLRIVLDSGEGFDFREPSKTKRITLHVKQTT